MAIILISFILLYILREGKDLIKNRSWQEGLLGLALIAVSLVYGIDYIQKAVLCPTWARCLRNCSRCTTVSRLFLGC